MKNFKSLRLILKFENFLKEDNAFHTEPEPWIQEATFRFLNWLFQVVSL